MKRVNKGKIQKGKEGGVVCGGAGLGWTGAGVDLRCFSDVRKYQEHKTTPHPHLGGAAIPPNPPAKRTES